jgi:hypothetical protein
MAETITPAKNNKSNVTEGDCVQYTSIHNKSTRGGREMITTIEKYKVESIEEDNDHKLKLIGIDGTGGKDSIFKEMFINSSNWEMINCPPQGNQAGGRRKNKSRRNKRKNRKTRRH